MRCNAFIFSLGNVMDGVILLLYKVRA